MGTRAAADQAGADRAVAADEARCANCGAAVADEFCPHCGQETRLKLPTLREFIREAAGRYVALDGRFWRTVAALISRPGFLTREYLAGRRRRYIRPARLYLFSTLIFFAVSRFFVEPADIFTLDKTSAPRAKVENKTGVGQGAPSAAPKAKGNAVIVIPGDDIPDDAAPFIDDPDVVANLPAPVRRNWDHFKALSRDEKTRQIADGMMRYAPYALFVLLPVFAWLLQILYIGSGRRRPLRPRLYGEHLVFAAHNHALLFVVATAMLIVPLLPVRLALFGWIVAYLWLALRRVYGGTRSGAVVRSVLLIACYAALLGAAVVILVIVATLAR